MENRRGGRPVKVFKGAVIAFAGTTVPCMVSNLSESGAMLELKSGAGIPGRLSCGSRPNLLSGNAG